jgi:hypothetical protein
MRNDNMKTTDELEQYRELAIDELELVSGGGADATTRVHEAWLNLANQATQNAR